MGARGLGILGRPPSGPMDETNLIAVDRDLELFTWRYEYALELGLPPDVAAEVAESRLDLHALETLIGRGCDPELGVRILA